MRASVALASNRWISPPCKRPRSSWPPTPIASRSSSTPTACRAALGEAFIGVYLAIKRAEYRQFMGEVGEQDWRWYLTQA
ncbi:hypothetical protein F3I16_13960 [Pseudomonas sp. L-22-4S-12]|nr:hypothetical protein [Pseudomonas sp. L-22-4S-12]